MLATDSLKSSKPACTAGRNYSMKLTAVIMLLWTSAANAQPPGGNFGGPPPGMMQETKMLSPEEVAEKETQWMKKKLKLSNDQLGAVTRINEDAALKKRRLMPDFSMAENRRPERRPASDGNSQAPDKTRELIARINSERDWELQNVLTTKQWEKYNKKKKSMLEISQPPANSPGFRQPPGGGGPPF